MINNRYKRNENVVLIKWITITIGILAVVVLNFWIFSEKVGIDYLTATVSVADKLSDVKIDPKMVTATKRYLVVCLENGEAEKETFDAIRRSMFLFNFLAIKVDSSEHPFHLGNNTLPSVVEVKTGTEIKFLLDYPESFRNLKVNDDFKNAKIIFKYVSFFIISTLPLILIVFNDPLVNDLRFKANRALLIRFKNTC